MRYQGVIVKMADLAVPVALLEIVAVVLVVTLPVLIVKVAEVAPAATVTEVGTVASDCPPDNVTTSPPFGAVAVNVTLPVELLPPLTDAGDNVSVKIVGGLIVRVAESVTPFRTAEIVALD